ncbi:MAG: T9SS type A sorting domain-containing protein [Weeksellaceae bacterium]|nr:T9SS type A sorting domain-containing protein [Weeksellaceae bacterium]
MWALAQYSNGAPFPVGSTGVSVKLETTPTIVRITLVGPSNSYLALGAGDQGMAAGADGFIYNSTASTDYTFAGVGVMPSPDAVQDWTINSNTVTGTTRTIVATRSLAGSAGDTPIPNATGALEVFVARGPNSLVLQYHGANRDYATLGMNFDPTLATGEVVVEEKAMIYPNPVGDVLHINNLVKIDKLKIYDAAGRVVISPALVTEKLDVTALQSGTYYVEVRTSDGKTAYEKIIKK